MPREKTGHGNDGWDGVAREGDVTTHLLFSVLFRRIRRFSGP
jgi:hypothetical protein